MADIHHEGIADAPISVAFAYVDDYRTTSMWMFGLKKFKAVDPGRVRGLGAAYDASFSVKPVNITSRVEITDWKENELIELTSVSGFSNRSTWRFSEEGPNRTRISVDFHYDLPGGLAGKALGKALVPIAAMSVRQSDANLRKLIADTHTATG
ncbi:SRPBCC family protein [Jatrophihabitans fulvus]